MARLMINAYPEGDRVTVKFGNLVLDISIADEDEGGMTVEAYPYSGSASADIEREDFQRGSMGQDLAPGRAQTFRAVPK